MSRENYRPGEKVTVSIEKIVPSKLFVRLPNGEKGVIRRREVSWDDKRPDLHQKFQVGQKLEAVVLPRFTSVEDDETAPIELSHRFVERNPWKIHRDKYHEGVVAEGIVKRVREFGAFVEVAPGVEGFLPAEEINPCRVKAQEVLWPGDMVQAVVIEFDPEAYRLRLSIKRYLERLGEFMKEAKAKQAGEAPFADHLRPADRLKLQRLLKDVPETLTPPEPQRIRRLLVVDDHDLFRQHMAALLRGWGYAVETAKDLQEGKRKFRNGAFDGVFLDLTLGADGDSTPWAEEICETAPHCHVLLLSGAETDAALEARLRAKGLTLEYKPFFAEEIADYLRRWERASLEQARKTEPSQAPVAPLTVATKEKPAYTDQDLRDFIADVARQAGMEGAAIFAISPDQPGKIEVVVQWGIDIAQDDESLQMLWYSPVGEILKEERNMVATPASHSRYDRYLRQAVRGGYQAAWGWRVTPPLSKKPMAFFVFTRRPGHRSPAIRPSTRHVLGVLLEQPFLVQVLEQAQSDILNARLRAGALHDVRNTLNALNSVLVNLDQQMAALTAQTDPRVVQDFIGEIASKVGDILAGARQMKSTLEMFRALEDKHESHATDIHALIRQSVLRFRPLAQNRGIELKLSLDENMPAGHFSPTWLRQVLDNVILNAIQWSSEDPFCPGVAKPLRQVTISTRYVPPKHLPLRIYVADSGPGVHCALIRSNKIYEFGYSQRPGGLGLGLFMAKQLVEAMGGDIQVVRSLMGVGSVFRVRLPEQSTDKTQL